MEKKAPAILCPRCGKLVSRDAESCYSCGMNHPGRMHGSPQLFKFISGRISYVDGIFYACIGLYILALAIDPAGINFAGGLFGLLSPSFKANIYLGMTGNVQLTDGSSLTLPWWTNITAIYLHGSLLHIGFNMLWLRQLGPLCEQLFGSSRFFLIYTLSGLAGYLISNTFLNAPTLGASGSVFGLLGAVIYYGRNRGGMFGNALYKQFFQWAVVIFIIGFLMPGINNFAHGGGLAGGYLSAMLLGYQEKSKEHYNHRLFALGALALTAGAFVIHFIYQMS